MSLKVSATDAAGSKLTETIARAFATQTAVAAAQETAAQRAAELVRPAATASLTAATAPAATGVGARRRRGWRVRRVRVPVPAGVRRARPRPGAVLRAVRAGARREHGRHHRFLRRGEEALAGDRRTSSTPTGCPSAAASRATVAVVEAFDTPKLETYLNDYRREYGLGSCTTANGCFRKVGQAGSAKHLPASGVQSGWDLEATLDVDMVSAACPTCRILVVEANGQDFDQLAAGVNTAIRLGAVAVSNSYGGRETGQDLTDARAYNHPGHAIVVSTGDFGYSAASFPANLPAVTAAGGTELFQGREQARLARDGVEHRLPGPARPAAPPTWPSPPGSTTRTARDAPSPTCPRSPCNLAIYNKDWGGWGLVGGTSASSPIIAGIYGLAGNATKVKPGYEYAHAKDLFDVVSGNNDWFFGTRRRVLRQGLPVRRQARLRRADRPRHPQRPRRVLGSPGNAVQFRASYGPEVPAVTR